MAYPICLCCWDAGARRRVGAVTLLALLEDRSREVAAVAVVVVGGCTTPYVGGLFTVYFALALED